MQKMIIIFIFALMILILVVNMVRSYLTSGEFFGRPPVNRFLFYSGKASTIIIWSSYIVHLLFYELSFIAVPEYMRQTGFVFFICGAFFIIASFLALGRKIRFGLSKEIELKVDGIYRLSRNPMYLGFYLVDMAVIAYTLNPLIIVLFIVVLLSHHRIILAEEEFISKALPDAWKEYAARTRRYI